ncbi:carboxypeptidase A [Cercophora newfieldiana]|uniref:Carboxypeptidase A n=1 Tax=Cercophora newfieldiana TaxID=92897 RepID=A0AA39Y9J1_9PEZI|nr:carboxypeptidase A [Cercophora newfieldiana]
MKATAAISLLWQLLAFEPAAVSACLTAAEMRGENHISVLHRRQRMHNLTNEGTIPIGVGDRFQQGTVLPVGIGSQAPANLTTVYNVVEIESATRSLVREYNLQYFETPFKTYENATMFGIKIPCAATASKAASNASYTVLLEAGIHARERGGPDHLLNFISDLLWAEGHGTGLIYGGVEYTAAEVQKARSVGVVVLPLVNPDGVAYDHATNSCWRKNRNRASASPNDTFSIGVDLNRNFPPAWDYRKTMAPGTTDAISDKPSEIVYRGTAPLSEPETQNVAWTMDQMPDLKWFLDLHSMAGMMLYGWGIDTNQGKDKSMNLVNQAYDGKRGAIPDNRGRGFVYGEYYDPEEYVAATLAATNVADAMLAAGGRNYFAQQSAGLYPAPGGSSDHPMFRALSDPAKHKWANGFTLEFGQPNEKAECQFYPTVEMHQLNMMETGAAFMEILLSAAKLS